MKKPLVIGLVGEKGSGKETFAEIFCKVLEASPFGRRKKVEHVKFSDLLKETLALWSLPATRPNLQDLVVIMDKHFGEGTLSEAIYQRIIGLSAEIVLVDGIRWDSDIVLLNRFPKHKLIYITADLKVRFERICQRREKIGEGESYEQFLKEEQAANEISIPRLGAQADVTIQNNKTLREFKSEILNAFKSIL